MKEQTVVIKSTISNFNATLGNLDHNEKILIENMNKIEKALNDKNSQINYLDLKVAVDEHISMFNLMFNQYQLETISLINAVLVAQKGQLHPTVLTPSRLVSELQKVSHNLPQGLEFPLPLQNEFAHLLLNTIGLDVYFQNPHLVYIINVPLTDSREYSIFRLSPLPVHVIENKYIFIQPISKYLAVSDNKQHYLTISENQFTKCKKFHSYNYLCKQQQPIYLAYRHEICEIKLYRSISKVPSSCDKRITELENSIWTQLTLSNSWIYVIPKEESVTINCKNTNPFDIRLFGVGKISLRKGCKAYSSSAMLISHSIFSDSTIFLEYVPNVDLDFDCCEDNSNSKINITQINLSKHYKVISRHLDDLNIASHKLDEIDKINDKLRNNIHNQAIVHKYSILAYIVGSIVLLLIFYCICKKTKNCCGICSRAGLCIHFKQRVNTNVPQTHNMYFDRELDAVSIRNSRHGSEPSPELCDRNSAACNTNAIVGRRPTKNL
ncbi:uncharacterized protein LOC116174295 [Photinus pyralis]|uniref:uncharacterized protein LOC116174295 n=1 Tax=Photinus pyralis TaxID=7054 RepID=UPI001266F349|nr:uncharacterized protein LOC116174295 [Photinus pyralis]